MTRNHFEIDLRAENAEAARNGAMALLIVVTFGLIMALWVLWSQLDRVVEALS
jgi:hypothetical protein